MQRAVRHFLRNRIDVISRDFARRGSSGTRTLAAFVIGILLHLWDPRGPRYWRILSLEDTTGYWGQY